MVNLWRTMPGGVLEGIPRKTTIFLGAIVAVCITLLGTPSAGLAQGAKESETTRSAPPDTKPYTRPAIPKDYAPSPKPAVPSKVSEEPESTRSAPPDTKPYTRPAIPEDYAPSVKPAIPSKVSKDPQKAKPPVPFPRNQEGTKQKEE